MANDWFRFKQFTVRQSGSAMKVGTDGVLLGAWCSIDPSHRSYLDIGTGTGLIALMLAQRVAGTVDAGSTYGLVFPPGHDAPYAGLFVTDGCREGTVVEKETRSAECDSLFGLSRKETPPFLRIDGVEIDGESARQAAQNAASSLWGEIIRVYHADIITFASDPLSCQEVIVDFQAGRVDEAYGARTRGMELVREAGAEGKYDHIVSNPPWFVDSLESPYAGRTQARHTSSLSYGQLIDCVCRLLNAGGMLSVVLPSDMGAGFVSLAAQAGLALVRRTRVRTIPGCEPKRVLLEFVYGKEAAPGCREGELTVGTGTPGAFTAEYMELTADFYLKF